jgi:F-type H+-transporting ATPase subunit delta
MKITKQARRDGKQLFRSCAANGLLDEGKVRQTVQAVLTQKPRGYLAILSHFQRLLRLDIERRTARIESATALSPEQRNEVQNNLAGKYGAGLNVNFAENAALIGGMRVRVGSDVYDGSIKARLNELEASF